MRFDFNSVSHWSGAEESFKTAYELRESQYVTRVSTHTSLKGWVNITHGWAHDSATLLPTITHRIPIKLHFTEKPLFRDGPLEK